MVRDLSAGAGQALSRSLPARSRQRIRAWSSAVLVVCSIGAPACGGSATGKTADGAPLPVNVIQVNPARVAARSRGGRHARGRDETVVSAEVEARVARLAADMGDRVAAGAPLVILDRREAPVSRRRTARRAQQTRARLGARGDELPTPEQTPDVVSALAQQDGSGTAARPGPAAGRQEPAPGAGTGTRRRPSWKRRAPPTTRRWPRRVTCSPRSPPARRRSTAPTATCRTRSSAPPSKGSWPSAWSRPASSSASRRRSCASCGCIRCASPPRSRSVSRPAIRVGQSLNLRVDAFPDRPIEGRVTRISPDVNLRSRAFSIEGEVPNPDGALKPGTFARVSDRHRPRGQDRWPSRSRPCRPDMAAASCSSFAMAR